MSVDLRVWARLSASMEEAADGMRRLFAAMFPPNEPTASVRSIVASQRRRRGR